MFKLKLLIYTASPFYPNGPHHSFPPLPSFPARLVSTSCMASRRQSPTPKRTLALKRADGEPLTRADIQYDVLNAIFSDRTLAFTDPYNSSEDAPKVCFRDLYIKAITNSPKATKALKDKMAESSDFAEDFAMLALLVNVGRINTTMSFFPEMKTAIRTYHPIPTLQRTSGNLQDAPRIKLILKMGLLERETQSAPNNPEDILSHARAGRIPSTSILNLIFVLSSHSSAVGTHFSQRFDFLDVFLRTEISSQSRAQAFLWMCFNYLENPGSASDDYDEEEKPNPFADPSKNSAPSLISLSPEEALLENVDSPEDKAHAEKLISNRDNIVKQHAAKGAEKEANRPEEDDQSVLSDTEAKGKGKKKGAAKGAEKPKRAAAPKEKKAATEKSRKDKLKKDAKSSQNSVQGSTPRDDMSVDDDSVDISHAPPGVVPRLITTSDSLEDGSHNYRILSSKGAEPKNRATHRYSPYPRSPDHTHSHKPRAFRSPVPERTMFQHAWYIINNTDPLMDSDDERGDEYDRHDYMKRLKVVSQLAQRQWTEPSHALQLSVELSGT
ncbi:hypothetical protein H1R20_g8329, partial [Candolleomyces eurysporus]